MKRFALTLLLTAMCVAAVFAYTSDEVWFRTHYRKTEYMIPMRDGVKLYTAVYSPRDTTRTYPILIKRTPYSCAPYGDTPSSMWKSKLEMTYARQGYIIVAQDVRGRWHSEGEFEDVRPLNPLAGAVATATDEATDSYDTVEWLLHNTPNNGKVGVRGTSYSGFYALMAGASRHPAIVAISPQAPVCDWFVGDDWHHNGALTLLQTTGFAARFASYTHTPTGFSQSIASPIPQDSVVKFFSTHEIRKFTKYFDGRSQLWNMLMAHPDYDEFWQERNAENACRDIRAATLVVGGTYDAEDCYGAWTVYKAIRRNNPAIDCRLVMGAWTHGAWTSDARAKGVGYVTYSTDAGRFYREEIEVPFFNHYLYGDGEYADRNKAQIFFSGENRWRTFDEGWQQPDKQMTLYFAADRTLSRTAPVATEGADTYTSDPALPVPYYEECVRSLQKGYMNYNQLFASSRSDVLTYITEPLTAPLTLAGEARADLRVKISTTDADFVVKVIDVSKSGRQTLVRGEIMRGRYRRSLSAPEPFVEGQADTVAYTLPAFAHTFEQGHRIMVQVQSSWFPLFDMNPQQFVDPYTCSREEFIKSDITLLRNASCPSSITFGVIE